MESQIKACQNCKKDFIVDEQDFNFYEKIKVPAPTWCPSCRLQRRLSVRNERILYKRKCDLCGKDIISIYHKDSPCVVYCQQCWWSDKWDPMDYAKEYDFDGPFFQQFKELMMKVPRVSLINSNSVNAEYTNLAADNKNCYLLFESSNNERCDYSYWMQLSKDCMDCFSVNDSELCYEVLVVWNCYKLFFSKECRDCVSSYFLKNCIDCSDCYGCINLNHKKFHIFNKPYSKEEYFEILKEKQRKILNGEIEELKKEFEKFALKYINKYAYIQKSIDSTGNYLLNTKNCKNCFYGYDAEYCKYGYHVWRNAKDCMDVSTAGRDAELVYECINTGIGAYNIKFGMFDWNNNHNLEYCDSCQGSSDLFGCISLRNKNFCIFNKEYSKEEYKNLVEKIIQQMKGVPYEDGQGKSYKYGEFFPSSLSLFGYNETPANSHFPLLKEQAIEQGYFWKDQEDKNINITIKPEDIPSNSNLITNEITKEIIGCSHKGKCDEQCTKAFKIIPQELEFYKKMGLPLPKLCPNCRDSQRLKQRNPLKLWDRQCAKCGVDIKTSYAPERSEIVYCEECYKREVE